MLADPVLDRVGQTRGEARCGQILVGIQQRECAALDGQIDGGEIRLVAHDARDISGKRARLVGVVAQAQHRQGVAQPGIAQPDAALVPCFLLLFGQRPCGDIQHVVQHAHRGAHQLLERFVVEDGMRRERVFHHARQVDRAQTAAAVGGEGLLSAWVGGLDHLAIGQVVVPVHQVDEQHTRFGVVVSALHDLLPQIGGLHLAIHPLAVGALDSALCLERFGGFCFVHQFERLVVFQCLHQSIGHADRDVEIFQVALVLGMDEALDVGMVAAQHTHLRTAPRAGRFHGLAGAVEHAHVGDRPARTGIGALDLGALGADGRKIVADTAAAPHGFGGLLQRIIDTGLAVMDSGD